MTPEVVLNEVAIKAWCIELITDEYPKLGNLLPFIVSPTNKDGKVSKVVVYEQEIDNDDLRDHAKNVFFKVEPGGDGMLIRPSSPKTGGRKLSFPRSAVEYFFGEEDPFRLRIQPCPDSNCSDKYRLSLDFGNKILGGEAGELFATLYEFSGKEITPIDFRRRKSIYWVDEEFVLIPFEGSKGWGVLVIPRHDWNEKVGYLKDIFGK